MLNNNSLLNELEQLLKWKKSRQFYAEKLGISITEVEELIKELKKPKEETYNYPIETPTITFETSNSWKLIEEENNHITGNKKITLESDHPLSPKEIEELVKVDNITTFVDRSWLKSHKNGIWTYSILTISKHKQFTEGQFLEKLKTISFPSLSINLIPVLTDQKEEADIEISIADFHLDRLTLKVDKIEDRAKEYVNTVVKLITTVDHAYKINRVIFTIGNDFLNSDNYQGATTNLTPQDNSVTWDKAYEVAFSTLVQAISIIKIFANQTEVYLVNGNHDRTKMYFIAHALQQYFQGDENVSFNRTSEQLKFNVVGETFIGYHHGNCKIDDLPLIFATSPESSAAFGLAKYREIHTADKHFYMEKEIKGVRILQTPSMVNPDRWSNDGNYINNIRAGLVLVYNKDKGRIALFEHRI